MGLNVGEFENDHDDFSIEYLREQQSYNMPATHYHEHYEIYYQLSGERNFFIENRVYQVHTGDLVLLNIHDLHKTMSAGTRKYGRLLMTFRRDFLSDLLPSLQDINLFYCFENECKVLTLTLAQREAVEKLLFDMLDEVAQRKPGYLTSLRLGVLQLLLFTARNAHRTSEKPGIAPSPIHEIITQAAQYINGHYAEDLTLKSIASMFNISYYYFCRIFKEVTGFTLMEYINSVRVKQAQRLLIETGDSITQIAGEVGFESTTNFGRVFKSMVHVSPLQYRKQQRGRP